MKPIWKLRITTGDWRGLCRALRDISVRWGDQAMNSHGLTHDDDVDSDAQCGIEVGTLVELLELCSVVGDCKHIVGMVLFACVEQNGVRTWASIGRDWLDKADETACSVYVGKEHRETVLHQAVNKAIDTLTAASR